MKLVLLLIVVASLVLGPLMMMRPSPAQKKRERWRSLARAKGIHFSMRQLPQQATEQEKPAPLSVYFFAPEDNQTHKDWMLMRATYAHELHFMDWWIWQGEGRASVAEQEILRCFLGQVSNAVMGVSSGSQGICVYWREQGDEEQFNNVVTVLESLQKLDSSV